MGRKLLKFFKSAQFLSISLYLIMPWSSVYGVPVCDESKVIINSRYKPLVYQIEVADTYDSRRKGLMYRKYIALDHGMLFIFEKAKYVQMWMKNTELNLDIIFVNNSGIITQIIRNASPMSEKIYSSNIEVKYVLEFPSNGKDVSLIEVGNSIFHCSLSYNM